MKSFLPLCCSVIFAITLPAAVTAQTPWLPFGPYGGDARSFAADPHDHNHIYLGTLSGTIYDSHDGGDSWKRLARPAKRDDLALDNIVVDPLNPNRVLVGAWVLDHADGGLFISNDAGHTWSSNPQMAGHSIRSFTGSPSNPKMMVIGALDGVYRTLDGGNTWSQISPSGSNEIREVESVAIDPVNPQIIYAGTWHLPWKTVDGGAHWTNMKEGIIDDSDVFSIIVDPSNAQNVFLSACSGIYRSTNQGGSFVKIQGIPSTARRTRVLMEDPKAVGTVFAGTTEGLWKTSDAGHTFLRNGDSNWIVNDVNIDSKNSNRVLLATDRTGVLLSTDGGLSFTPSNRGFSSRQISAVAQDRSNSQHIYVGVVNDKAAGGVFDSTDGGLTWVQHSLGLNGADIFSLAQAADGTLLAGARHGIYRFNGETWSQSSAVIPNASDMPPPTRRSTTTHSTTSHGTATRSKTQRYTPPPVAPSLEIASSVYILVATENNSVFAGTADGMFTSNDNGHTWHRVTSTVGRPWRMAAAQGLRVAIADLHDVGISVDRGANFHDVRPPSELTYVTAVAIDDGGRIWIGGREGVWVSENDGASWHPQPNLFVPNISSIFYDRAGSRVLVSANQPNTLVFSVHTPDMKVTYQDSGWGLRMVRPVGDHMLGITPYDGLVIQPRMVDSPVTPTARALQQQPVGPRPIVIR